MPAVLKVASVINNIPSVFSRMAESSMPNAKKYAERKFDFIRLAYRRIDAFEAMVRNWERKYQQTELYLRNEGYDLAKVSQADIVRRMLNTRSGSKKLIDRNIRLDVGKEWFNQDEVDRDMTEKAMEWTLHELGMLRIDQTLESLWGLPNPQKTDRRDVMTEAATMKFDSLTPIYYTIGPKVFRGVAGIMPGMTDTRICVMQTIGHPSVRVVFGPNAIAEYLTLHSQKDTSVVSHAIGIDTPLPNSAKLQVKQSYTDSDQRLINIHGIDFAARKDMTGIRFKLQTQIPSDIDMPEGETFSLAAWDLNLDDRNVQIRFIKPSVMKDAAAFKRMHEQAILLAEMNHPVLQELYTTTVHELEDGRIIPGVVLEKVDGKNYSSIIPSNHQHIVQVAQNVAGAPDYLNARGFSDQNLRPENIIIQNTEDEVNRVKLVELGLHEIGEIQFPVEDNNPYAAPEITKNGHISTRSDQYALAKIVYELLGGVISPIENKLASITSIPDTVMKVLQRAASISPHDRFNSSGEFADALKRAFFPPPATLPER